jgi:ribosomal protein S9
MEILKPVFIASGKRKTCIAKAFIKDGTGKITINKINYEFLPLIHRLIIKEPLEIALSQLFRIQNVATKRTDKINSDEE